MEILTDIRTKAKRNAEKMKSVDRNFEKQAFYKDGDIKNIEHTFQEYKNYSTGYDESSFSIRMIIVMLLLAVTMFLKQEDVLDNNNTYQSVMAEIHRQITIDDVNEAVDAISQSVLP